jgi:hypothetical protein
VLETLKDLLKQTFRVKVFEVSTVVVWLVMGMLEVPWPVVEQFWMMEVVIMVL